MSGLVVVVPIRSFRGGKSRLSTILGESGREALVRAMFHNVLKSVKTSGVCDEVLIVSPDPEVLDRAAQFGGISSIIQPPTNPGLNASADLGRAWALEHGYDRMLVLFGDLPLIEADDIEAIALEALPIVIATDRHGNGTNGLLLDLRVPETHEFRFAYGAESARLHFDEATRHRLPAISRQFGGVAFDLDTVEDVDELRAMQKQLPEWLATLTELPEEIGA